MFREVFICFLAFASLSASRYCQPEDDCWPSQDEVNTFAGSLSPVPEDDKECSGLPTFSSVEQQGDPIHNYWYSEAPDEITPYQLANLRNKVADDISAYFVVIARNESDVVKAVQFAASHNLGISVFSTGHEFNDRNAGSGENSLLIRTTCLRMVQFDLEHNRFDHPDGSVRLGSGMTWGDSKFGSVGVHELARDNERVVVSGHAGNVGIVGWSLGGGHGQLVGAYGMGVDQVLEVEMVIADGSRVVANADGTLVTSEGGLTENTDNTDLFWALRGGGAGPWGIITAMTIKVHKPRNSCQTGCYSQWIMVWESNFNDDDGKMMEDVAAAYLKWVSTASKYWSSYGTPFPGEDGKYNFMIFDALYVGTEKDEGDYWSLEEAMADVHPDKLVYKNKDVFDTFLDKVKAQPPESVDSTSNVDMMPSVLLNVTATADPSFPKMMVDNWIPRCYRNGIGPSCVASYLFMHTLTGEEDDDYTGSAVSPTFRKAKMHVGALYYISLGSELSHDERTQFAHDVVGPAFYEYSDGSYYSESEYSLDGSWKERFWGAENYQRLLTIKRTWDPTFVFSCRHCVGDEEEPGQVDSLTMPTWRRT